MTKYVAQKVVFDLDGTLVDSAPDLVAAANHCLNHVGRPSMTLAAARHMAGHGALPLIGFGLERSGGLNGIDPKSLHSMFLDFYRSNISRLSALYPHVSTVLDGLSKSGFQLAICTNKPETLAHQLLKEMEIASYFSVVHGGDSLPHRKPDPLHIALTLEAMAGDGAGVMVGDTASDIVPAKAMGIPAIGVAYGYSQQPIAELEPDYIIHSMADLPGILTCG